VKLCRRRGVEQQGDRKGFVGRLPIGNWLFDAIFENAEVPALQVRDEAALTVHDSDRNCNQTSVDAKYFTFANFFWARVNSGDVGRGCR
jgi:hypothetical protein